MARFIRKQYLLNNFKEFFRKTPPVILVALVLLGIVSAIFFIIQNGEVGSLDARVEASLRNCELKSENSFDYRCFREKVDLLFEENEVGEILNSLEVIYANQESENAFGTLTCHGPGHIAGEVAIENGASFGEVLRECSRKCDYGCLHGAFLQQFELDENFLDDLTSICSEFKNTEVEKDLTSCYHILGHGLIDIYGRDVKGALDQCDRLPEEGRGNIECGRGVVMEYMLGSPENYSKFRPEEETVVSFCERIPQPHHRESCFRYAGFYAYSIKDARAAVDACNSVPQEDQEDCIYSFGSIAYFSLRSEPEKILETCNYFEENLAKTCIKGALEINVGEKPYIPIGVFLCRNSAQEFKQECFRHFGNRLLWAWGEEYRNEICSELNEVEKESCISDID